MSEKTCTNDTEYGFSLDVPDFPMGIPFGPYPTQGFLEPESDGTWFVSTEDYLTTLALPSFIKDRESAISFLRHAYRNFINGIDAGAQAQKRETADQVAEALGMPTTAWAKRMEREVEELQKKVIGE